MDATVLVVLGLVALAVLWVARNIWRARQLGLLLNQHQKALITTYYQSVRKDQYGKLVLNKWLKEIDYFTKTVVAPQFGWRSVTPATLHNFRRLVHQEVEKWLQQQGFDPDYSESMSGSEFEHFCARRHEKLGWSVEVTKASGDQGIDLIARKGAMAIGIQCKKYRGSVGNAAVQEADAGARFYRLDRACVVSNAQFTESAKQLAASNGVRLLHYTQLEELE